VDEQIPPRPESPYTLDYRGPAPTTARSLTPVVASFGAGVLAGLLALVGRSFYFADIDGPDSCACFALSSLYFWAALLIFNSSCRMRRAQMLVVRVNGDVRALLCGIASVAAALLAPWLPVWAEVGVFVHMLVFPAVATLLVFGPPPPPEELAR
jgi:hypothetical protein